MKRTSIAGLPMLLVGLSIVGGLCPPSRVQGDENWAEWRGPRRNGVSEATGLPETWSASEGLKWATPLPGRGTSSAVVWNDLVCVTAADGPRQSDLHVIGVNLADGKIRWHAKLWGTAPTLHHGTKSDMATPTPAMDAQHVYAFFGTGDVFALDRAGRLVWQRSLADEFGPFENRFGHTSSPLLYDDLLILQCDHYGESYLLAVERSTGKTRWKVARPGTWHSWSSPRLVDVPDSTKQELVVCAAHRVDAFDPATGASLWTVGGLRRECIPTPVAGQGRLYVVSGPKGETLAIRPGGRGDVTQTHVDWRSARGVPFVPSALLVGDYYYLVDDAGIATCLDAHSGKSLWQKRLGGAFTASPIAGDGKIYFTNENGETIVLAAHSGAYKELARNKLDDPVYASASIAPGRLLIRAEQRLICVGK